MQARACLLDATPMWLNPRGRLNVGHRLGESMEIVVAGGVARRALGIVLVAAVAAGSALAARAQSGEFPFGKEMLLDARPMKGSKRVPVLEIDDAGTATIDLWCNSLQGKFVVAADTVTIITGDVTTRECPADRAKGDEDIVNALNQVTNWRRQGDTLTLIGPTTLRFRLTTN
jgi:heat shock protein HslJ